MNEMWARMGGRVRTEYLEGILRKKNDFYYTTNVDMANFFHKVYAWNELLFI